MKKFGVLGVMCALAVLAFTPAVFADLSPARQVVIPEAVWAAASGGGTWTTALQLVAKNIGTNVYIQFFYQNTSSFRTISMFTSTIDEQAVRYSNVMATMGLIDTSFAYYGRAGTLLIFGQDADHPVYAQAMTTNGNYGKSLPSFSWDPILNSADVGRQHVIPGMQNNTTWRTSTGFWNSTSGTMNVNFYVMLTGYVFDGAMITRTFQPWGFMAFNPFAQAGISANSYTNTYLLIWPTAKSGSGQGLYCYGSLANNYTNDTMALISQPFQ